MEKIVRKIHTIYIVAGGNLSLTPKPNLGKHDLLIGVDYGAFWLLEKGIVPHVAIGDFDSVSAVELKRIKSSISEVFMHKPEKDDTDLALAVAYAITKQPRKIIILGAVGTRMDHTWAAMSLLLHIMSHNIDGEIVDNFNKIYIVRRQKVLAQDLEYAYVSVIPLTNTVKLTLEGFKYNVRRKKIPFGSTLGVSNEILQKEAKVQIHAGLALLIQSRD